MQIFFLGGINKVHYGLEKVVIQESGRKITATTTITIISILVNDIMIISHYLSESGSCFRAFS